MSTSIYINHCCGYPTTTKGLNKIGVNYYIMKEEDVLQELGLETREAKIYLALLKLTSTTASKVAEDVGIDRTTTYDILSRLIEKGIVSYVIKNNVKYFKSSSPQQLLQDLKEKEKRLQEIMPKLLALEKEEKEQTNVELFKGKEGMITVLKMIVRDKKDYWLVGGAQEICRSVPIFMKQFLKQCHTSKIKGKLICEEGFGSNLEDIIGKHETYRIISKKLVSSTIKVWGNKTAFFVFSEPVHTILITSVEVADRQRQFFEFLWKQAKEPNKINRNKTLIK